MFQRNRSVERAQLKYLGQLTWRTTSQIKNKAMEQQFTWSGFALSLSIAFFVVFGTSSALNAVYEKSLGQASPKTEPKVYILEGQIFNSGFIKIC